MKTNLQNACMVNCICVMPQSSYSPIGWITLGVGVSSAPSLVDK